MYPALEFFADAHNSRKTPSRVSHVEALPGFRPRVTFSDGADGVVEMAAFLDSPGAGVFGALCDKAVFRQAKVELGPVTSPGDLDLVPGAMHRGIKGHGIWIAE